MTKLTLEQQELLFANDCKLINLRYEYHGYTGTEKWAIVTELAEEELWGKYPDVIRRYTPFILLSMAQGEVITEYQNYEANGKPLIQTQTLKREKLKLSLNSKAVHSSFLMLRQLRICLKNTAPCTE